MKRAGMVKILTGAPITSGIRAKRMRRGGLGWSMDAISPEQQAADMALAEQGGGGSVPSLGWQDPFTSSGGIQASDGGSSIGSGITSFISGLFGTKTSTPGYVPTSNTSTYLLIGGVIVGGIVLWAVLK